MDFPLHPRVVQHTTKSSPREFAKSCLGLAVDSTTFCGRQHTTLLAGTLRRNYSRGCDIQSITETRAPGQERQWNEFVTDNTIIKSRKLSSSQLAMSKWGSWSESFFHVVWLETMSSTVFKERNVEKCDLSEGARPSPWICRMFHVYCTIERQQVLFHHQANWAVLKSRCTCWLLLYSSMVFMENRAWLSRTNQRKAGHLNPAVGPESDRDSHEVGILRSQTLETVKITLFTGPWGFGLPMGRNNFLVAFSSDPSV